MIQSDEERGYDPVQLMARVIAYIPIILLKSGTSWLSFKRQAKKGGKAFQKELIRQGIDKETAVLFTQEYTNGSNLLKLFLDRS